MRETNTSNTLIQNERRVNTSFEHGPELNSADYGTC